MAEIGWRKMEKPISGIHHVTAIASNPQRNLDFYTEVLGLRLVKRTVNFDDPGTYQKMDSSWNWLLASGIGSRMHGAEN